jgi:subtilisin-like proprotein convertase family protein
MFTRRSFLKTSGATTGLVVLGSAAGVALLKSRAHGLTGALEDLLMGDPNSPYPMSSHEKRTMLMLADTGLPDVGDNEPGGLAAYPISVLNDPFYGLAPFIGGIVEDIDWYSVLWSDDFKDLSLSQRTQFVEERIGDHDPSNCWDLWGEGFDQSCWPEAYESAIMLTKLAFYGGLNPSLYAGTYFNAADDSPMKLPMSIPDNNSTGVTHKMGVFRLGNVTSLKVSVNISHSYKGDLKVQLISPSGTTYILHNRSGGSTNNVVISNLSLSTFNGQPAWGHWKLKVSDHASWDTGQINSWSLTVTTDGATIPVAYEYIGHPGESQGYWPGTSTKASCPLPAADSCVGDCGGSGGNCYCDDLCHSYGDCCSDYEDVCL